MRKAILGLCAGLALALLAPAGVLAQRDDDWYRDVRPFLEPADRLCGRRTVEPVDRAPVEAMRTQADLEGGDARIGCRGARGKGRDGKDQGQSEERSGKHGRTVFAVSAGIP